MPSLPTHEGRFHKGHLLGFVAWVLIPFGLFVPNAIAPLFIAVAVLGAALDFFRGNRTGFRFPLVITGILGSVLLWGAVGLFWSRAVDLGLDLLAAQTGKFLAGLLVVAMASSLKDEERRSLRTALVFGTLFGFALLAIEVFTPLFFTKLYWPYFEGSAVETNYAWSNYIKKGVTVAALVIWPALAATRLRFGTVAALVFGAFAMTTVMNSDNGAAILAFFGGAVAATAWFTWRDGLAKPAVAFLVFLVIAMPLIPRLLPSLETLEQNYTVVPQSVFPRVFIWNSAVDLIAEKPFLGYGINTSRTFSSPEKSAPYSFRIETGSPRMSEPIPLHPHNAGLQIWLELGFVGAVLFAAFLASTVRGITRLKPVVVSAAGMGVFCAALITGFVTYSIWSTWWEGLLWLMAALMVGLGTGLGNPPYEPSN